MEMKIRILDKQVTREELGRWALEAHGDMIKAVVDVQREMLAVGGELHSDAEAVLLEQNSRQEDLWGINLYPAKPVSDRIEYHSLINIKPRQKHSSMEIQDPGIRERISRIVNRWVDW